MGCSWNKILIVFMTCYHLLFVVDNAYDDAEFKKLANKVFRRGSHSGNTPRVDTIISSFQVGPVGVMSCDLKM